MPIRRISFVIASPSSAAYTNRLLHQRHSLQAAKFKQNIYYVWAWRRMCSTQWSQHWTAEQNFRGAKKKHEYVRQLRGIKVNMVLLVWDNISTHRPKLKRLMYRHLDLVCVTYITASYSRKCDTKPGWCLNKDGIGLLRRKEDKGTVRKRAMAPLRDNNCLKVFFTYTYSSFFCILN